MFWLMPVRRPHPLLLAAGLFAVSVYFGTIPLLRSIHWLSSQPSVSTAFRDPRFGYQDALIFLFSLVFLTPLAGLISIVALLFLLAVLGGMFLPVARTLTLPDWASTALAIGIFGTALWVSSPLWAPVLLQALGLIARAYVVVAG
jgi:hypothetical protein